MNNNLIQNENELKILLNEKDKEIKHFESKLFRKNNNSNSNLISHSYTNLFNINSNSTNSTYINSGVSKEKSVTRINLMKKTSFPIEKIRRNEKLNEYKKILNKRKEIYTRNKEYNKSYRERTKEQSIEKNLNHNFSSLSVINGNLEINIDNKEESKNKIQNKFILKNKKESLCEFIKKNTNKFLVTRIIQQKQLGIKK